MKILILITGFSFGGILILFLILLFSGVFKPQIFSEKTIQASEAVLENIKTLNYLSLIESTYKVVFPHDFIKNMPSDDPLAWSRLAAKPADSRTPEDRDNLEILRLARETGVPIDRDPGYFFVFTYKLKAGFPLDRKPEIIREPAGLRVILPQARILDIQLADRYSQDYPFPDQNLTPGNYRKISEFIKNKIEILSLKDGIISRAESAGLAYLRSLLPVEAKSSVIFEIRGKNETRTLF